MSSLSSLRETVQLLGDAHSSLLPALHWVCMLHRSLSFCKFDLLLWGYWDRHPQTPAGQGRALAVLVPPGQSDPVEPGRVMSHRGCPKTPAQGSVRHLQLRPFRAREYRRRRSVFRSCMAGWTGIRQRSGRGAYSTSSL